MECGLTLRIDKLKALSKKGVPESVRAVVWKLLLGYLPVNKGKQIGEMNKKRKEYTALVEKIYPEIENNKTTKPDELWDQIYVDVIRTFPTGMENFCDSTAVRDMLCRVLYVYSVTHQGGNYWQGLNEIPVPFMITFTSFYSDCSLRQLNLLSTETIAMSLSSGSIEADVYWCVHNFVHYLQSTGGYVVSEYGTITERAILHRFGGLCSMVDSKY